MPGSLFGEDPIPTSADTRWWTAHCDGGSRGNPGPAGFGAVLVDPAGHKAAELSDFLGTTTNNVAEYRGLLATLDWAVAHDVTHLRVVSDSLLMVQQIKGRYKVNSPDLRPLWQQARDKIAQLARFEISHALRHKNKDADRLANEAMDRGTGKTARPSAGPPQPEPAQPASKPSPAMLRGFVKNGAVHFLGSTTLPDGTFVKVVPE